MTIQKIRDNISENVGKSIQIKYNGGRNKIEVYNGIIKDVYNFIFLIEANYPNRIETKSFSYADVLTETLVIKID